MKALAVSLQRRKQAQLHFSIELPLIPTPSPALAFQRLKIKLDRAFDLADLANEMTLANAGNFSIELAEPSRLYHDFLRDLVYTDGLAAIVDAGRHHLDVAAGVFFPVDSVCREVAECVRRHFYPDQPLRYRARFVKRPRRDALAF